MSMSTIIHVPLQMPLPNLYLYLIFLQKLLCGTYRTFSVLFIDPAAGELKKCK